MKAKIITISKEEGSPAVVEIDGAQYEAMDCIGYSSAAKENEVIDIEFSIGIDDEQEALEDVLNGNPCKEKQLKCIDGWSYRAYGEVTSVCPVIVDCGVAKFEDVFEILHPDEIGRYIAFNIERLDVWVNSKL